MRLKLYDLHSAPNVIRFIKSRRIRWVEHLARAAYGQGAYRVLVARNEGKKSLGSHGLRREDDIRMDIKELGLGRGVH